MSKLFNGFAAAAGTLLAVTVATGSALAQVQLNLAADIAIPTGTFAAGFAPAAVAWNGTDAFIGSYNNSGVTGNTGIVRISNALTAPSFSSLFGGVSTASGRGITGLALQGNNLAVSLDTGAGNANSVRSFDAATTNLNWNIGTGGGDSTRRGNGVAFDPGFNGGGTNQGVAYLSIGTGRRHLLNAGTGAYINGQNAGAIINTNPVSTVWRDLAFNPTTGDLFTRESNRLTFAQRNGDNTFLGGASTVLPTGLATAAAVDNQNLAFVNALGGNFIILNDRASGANGQALTNVVKAFGTTGNALTVNYSPGFAPGTGNGAYDFAFNSQSQTLALSDFSQQRLYIFNVTFGVTAAPEPATVALMAVGITALAGGGVIRRRRRA